MREVIFRGKETTTNKWVYGYLEFEEENGEKNTYITPVDEDYLMSEVYDDTIGQYTGLTDRNGKKIFEGDIVNWRFSPCVVKWDSINACYSLYQKGITKISGFNADTMKLFEVIGNIHDNSELLEVR